MNKRKSIPENVKNRLYAESMGRCMNPSCQKELFVHGGNLIEKAHIVPYCETADNSFENLIILCPNCHTDFDKNHAFASEEVLNWKKERSDELDRIFGQKLSSFDELRKKAAPLLRENKMIYENYYLTDKKELWSKFEGRVLTNNKKLKTLFQTNEDLFQRHENDDYSNLHYVELFAIHVDEFESTRLDSEKTRQVLFPKEINSMFGVSPVEDYMYPSVESLELLLKKLNEQNKLEEVMLGTDHPYIVVKEDSQSSRLYLDDMPRVRQMYHDNHCLRSAKVRLQSLNYALKIIRSKHLAFDFFSKSNLREISVCDTRIMFVYEYCLGQAELIQLPANEGDVVVNLHNWNGESCISRQAYELAKEMKVELLSMSAFYGYINALRQR